MCVFFFYIFLHHIQSNSLWAGHVIRMEDERIPKKICNGKFHSTRPVGKTKNKMGGCPEGHISDHRNMRREEMSRRQRRVDVSSEGWHVPEGAVGQ